MFPPPLNTNFIYVAWIGRGRIEPSPRDLELLEKLLRGPVDQFIADIADRANQADALAAQRLEYGGKSSVGAVACKGPP